MSDQQIDGNLVSVARYRCRDAHGLPSGHACRGCLVSTVREPVMSAAMAMQQRIGEAVQCQALRVRRARTWRAAGESIRHIMAHFGGSYAEVYSWLSGPARVRISQVMEQTGATYEQVYEYLHVPADEARSRSCPVRSLVVAA